MSHFSQLLKEYIQEKLPIKLMGNEFIAIIDTETTGFSKLDHDLISLSIEVRDYNWDLKDDKTLYASPQTKTRWTPKAEEIHGFSYDEACSFDHPRKTAISLLQFIKPFKTDDNKPLLFVSHDLNGFDFGFIEWMYRWQGLQYSVWKVFQDKFKLSTINMAREQKYQKNKLNNWADRLDFKLNHHEVKSDRMACSKIFKYLIENNHGMELKNQERSDSKSGLQL